MPVVGVGVGVGFKSDWKAPITHVSVTRLAEDGTARLAEDGTIRKTEGA
jgi:hypothetical protein